MDDNRDMPTLTPTLRVRHLAIATAVAASSLLGGWARGQTGDVALDTVEVDEDGITSGDPEDEPASVDIHLGDRVLSRAVRGGKGSLAVPMSETELTHKYRHLAGPVLGAGLAAVLEQRVLGLRDDPDVSGLPTSLAQR